MENNTLLPLALSYLNRGRSVIICGQDKRPILPWKEFQERLATPDELVQWFTDYPDAQVGIVTGKLSDLTVVDLEKDADFNLIKDETYSVKTGGGGIHKYFKYDSDFLNAVKILPNTDIRTEGGFIVAAGSKTSKGSYSELNNLEVAKMSDATKKILMDGKNSAAGSGNITSIWGAPSTSSLYPKISTDALEYQGVSQGGRNDSMAKFAGSIMARLHPSLWASIGWKIFEEANQKNTPPLGISELRATWISISNKETKANPGGRRYDLPQEKTWGPDQDIHHPVNDAGDSEPDGGSDPKDTLHASEVAALQTIDTDKTFSLGMKPLDDALLGGFSLGDLVVVAGRSGEGKTSIIQDWSVTLASGAEEGKGKLPILWFSYEVLAKPLWQKFQLMGASVETPIYMPRFNETGEIDWVVDVIERAIIKWGIQVVALDHLGFLRAPKGNYSNAADAITHTVRALKSLAVKRGLIILLPVHVKKTSSKVPDINDIKDSSGIFQEADTVIFINREKDNLGLYSNEAKLSLVKNRKTGVSVSVKLNFVFGRFYYTEGSDDMDMEQGNDI